MNQIPKLPLYQKIVQIIQNQIIKQYGALCSRKAAQFFTLNIPMFRRAIQQEHQRLIMFFDSLQMNILLLYLYLLIITSRQYSFCQVIYLKQISKSKSREKDKKQITNYQDINSQFITNIQSDNCILPIIQHTSYYFTSSLLVKVHNIYLQQNYKAIMMSSKYQQEEQFCLRQPHVKAKYSKTSMKKKQQLIDFVFHQKYTIYKASKKLKLSNSTAKSIISNYQKYGTILQKFTKNRILSFKSHQDLPKTMNQQKNIVKQQHEAKVVIKQEYNQEDNQSNKFDKNYYPFILYSYPFMLPQHRQ